MKTSWTWRHTSLNYNKLYFPLHQRHFLVVIVTVLTLKFYFGKFMPVGQRTLILKEKEKYYSLQVHYVLPTTRASLKKNTPPSPGWDSCDLHQLMPPSHLFYLSRKNRPQHSNVRQLKSPQGTLTQSESLLTRF